MTQSDDVAKLAREDDIVEREDERAFYVIILRLLGVDETDGQVNRIAPPVHELFRSRRAWRDLAKSRTKDIAAKDAQLTALAADVERLREAATKYKTGCAACSAWWALGDKNDPQRMVAVVRTLINEGDAALQPKGATHE